MARWVSLAMVLWFRVDMVRSVAMPMCRKLTIVSNGVRIMVKAAVDGSGSSITNGPPRLVSMRVPVLGIIRGVRLVDKVLDRLTIE